MKYNLVGIDGNAYAIMGYVASAMEEEEGKSKTEIDEYYKNATSGDYYHLLAVSFEMTEKLNEESGNEDFE